jgi:hypothetical protein
VNSYALGAKSFTILGYLDQIGQIAAARIAQQSNFVDVNA